MSTGSEVVREEHVVEATASFPGLADRTSLVVGCLLGDVFTFAERRDTLRSSYALED